MMPRKPSRRSHSERGAVLVETALVSGIILTFLLFSIQIGILGFLQVTADAASFVGARAATLSTADPRAYTASVFSQLKPSDVTSAAPQPAPTATIPVDYTYNNPNNPNYANAQYNRNGGFSEMQPELAKVSVTPSKSISVLGHLASVTGSDTEPLWTECGVHFNVASSNSACGDSAQPSNFAVNYFTAGENTPPYFVGFSEIQACQHAMPWGSPYQPNQNSQYASFGYTGTVGACPSTTEFLGLGVAERLDTDNWSLSSPGVGAATTSTFGLAGCHQRVYAQLATFFSTYTSLDQIYYHFYPSLETQFGTSTSSFTGWNGFATAPSGAPDTLGTQTDLLIQEVYNWDVIIASGEPLNSPVGAYPTKPGLGCP